jgi:spermidine/putrescine transport system ATP-binding protein
VTEALSDISKIIAVDIRAVSKRFGTVAALREIGLEIRRGEFLCLLGPSGCGKTTLLRVIAGLETADSGELWIDGENAANQPAHLRPVNTVFQSYALFPHLSVARNVEFGLRMKKVPATERKKRVAAALELLEIGPLSARMPAQLSGGQKQRVALARAIVNEPRVLLLDEPLAALDLRLRHQLQAELKALQQRLGMTFVHVTHDQEEALTLGDRVAVLNHGRIEQLDSPAGLYENPANAFVAEFVGACNLIPVSAPVADGSIWDTSLGKLRVTRKTSEPIAFLGIRPERIHITNEVQSDENCIEAGVESTAYSGAKTVLTLRVANAVMRATNTNCGGVSPFKNGDRVWIRLPPESLLPLPASA